MARAIWTRPVTLVVITLGLLCVPAGPRPEIGTSVTPADLGAVALVGVVALRQLAGERSWLRASVVVAIGAVGCGLLLATMFATDVDESMVGLVRQVEIFVAVPLAVALSIRSRADVQIVLAAMIAMGLVQGVVAVHQVATGTGASFAGEPVRPVGTFGAYNIMAMPTVVTYSLLAALAVAMEETGSRRYLAAGAVIFLPVPLALSLSRGAWLSAAVGALLILLLSDWRRALLLGAVAMLMGFIAVSFVRPDFGVVGARAGSLADTGQDRSVRDRYGLWGAALSMWRDRPLTGVGLKNFAVLRDTYAPLDLSSSSDVADAGGAFRRVELLSPHNLYLQTLSEQGLVGLLAFAGLLFALAIEALRRFRLRADTAVEAAMGVFALGLLGRNLVNAISGDLGGPGTVLQALGLGLLVWFAGGASVRSRLS